MAFLQGALAGLYFPPGGTCLRFGRRRSFQDNVIERPQPLDWQGEMTVNYAAGVSYVSGLAPVRSH